jgi:hypothetical protein
MTGRNITSCLAESVIPTIMILLGGGAFPVCRRNCMGEAVELPSADHLSHEGPSVGVCVNCVDDAKGDTSCLRASARMLRQFQPRIPGLHALPSLSSAELARKTGGGDVFLQLTENFFQTRVGTMVVLAHPNRFKIRSLCQAIDFTRKPVGQSKQALAAQHSVLSAENLEGLLLRPMVTLPYAGGTRTAHEIRS